MSRASSGIIGVVVAALCMLSLSQPAAAEPVPPPSFESDYKLPETLQPPGRAVVLEYVDVAVLAGALVLATLLAHVWRWRKGLVAMAIGSLLYFGFYRKGCICAIGAIQNVALGLGDPSYPVPLPAILFLALPLVFALLFGRVFCGAVCPMGAAQDLMGMVLPPAISPKRQSPGLAVLLKALRMLAYVYLGMAVLLAFTGSAFVICQYDPFVGFFRLSATAAMLALGAGMLALSMFVGRPYCRFLCPLGVLLGHASRLSWRPVVITPHQCRNCRLCESSCPYGAIRPVTVNRVAKGSALTQPDSQPARWGAIGATVVLTLLLTIGGGALFARTSSLAAGAHPTVRLAQRIWQEEHSQVTGTTNESYAFRRTHKPAASLFAQADAVHRKFVWGLWAVGAALGLIGGLKVLAAQIAPRRTQYQADRASCVACGRCFAHCPCGRTPTAAKGDQAGGGQ